MTRPVPYPADTRAKGWRFELDYEQIDQSDTWGLAAEIPMAQPALLMMWLVAWTQVPCGSLPNDEMVIRAKCKIAPKAWPAVREILMRGWWLAEDGRLYHDTLVSRALDMMQKRASNARRTATHRSRKADLQDGNDELTRLSRVTDASPTHEFDTKNQEPINTNTPLPPKGGGRVRPSSVETVPDGFEAFWAAYPRKVGKPAALKAFAKVRPTEEQLRDMLGAIADQRQSVQWSKDGGQFIPHPSTWLSQERWADGPATVAQSGLQLTGAVV